MVQIHWPEPGWPPEKHECMCDERDYQIIDKDKQYHLPEGFPCQNTATHCLIKNGFYTFYCERHAGQIPEDAGELIELPDSTFRVDQSPAVEVSSAPLEDPDYLTLINLPPGEELDHLVADVIFPKISFTQVPKFSQDIAEAFKIVKELGYVSLSTDEGISYVICQFLRGEGFGRRIQGYMTIPEVICKAAIASKKFPLEPIKECF